MRWALVALALLVSPASAQMFPGPGTPAAAGGGGYVGLGDLNSGYLAYYSLRAYSAADAAAGGAAADLRNTSTAETCTVPVASGGGAGTMQGCSGSSNGASLATFCAAGCAVSKLYDKTGNANHATQATAANQPTITLNCIGSLPCVTSNGSQWMTTPIGVLTPPSISVVGVSKRTGSFTSQGDTLSSNNGVFHTSTANTFGGFWGSSCSASASDSVAHALGIVFQGGTGALISVDGTVSGPSGCSGTSATSGAWNLFAQQGGFFVLTGSIMEQAIRTSALNSAQLVAVCHNQFGYYGTATSC